VARYEGSDVVRHQQFLYLVGKNLVDK